MMGRGMMLGKIVGGIVGAAPPINEKFALFDSVLDPIEAHVEGARAALFDGLVGNAGGAGVVSLQGSSGLRMTHFG